MPDTPTYPKRPGTHFAHKFTRLLIKACVANELGPEAALLLIAIAHTEDARGYRGPVTFWNGQLLPLIGLGSESALKRVRSKCEDAGWLVHLPGARGKPPAYWVSVPAAYAGWDDGPTDEAAADYIGTTGANGSVGEPESGQKADRKRPESGRKADGIRSQSEPPSSLSLSLSQEEDPPNPPPAGGGGGSAAPAGTEDLRTAVAEVTGLDPATAAKKLDPAVAALANADPPYTPAEVREFGRRFARLCPWAAKQQRDRPTPKELAERIGLIRAKPATRAPPGGPPTAEDILARRKREADEAEAARRDRERKGINVSGLFKPADGPE